ncbi:MAG: DUF429 domain-containing protein [Nitrospiraceae bacterium]
MGQRVAGVDGCKAGWMVVLVEEQGQLTQSSEVRLCTKFEEVLALSPAPAVIAVDIPIGLLETPQQGGRACDQEARRLLGRRRASSVFSPPSRTVLEARDYADARRRSLSIQAFGILPKIREVDRLMTLELQDLVHEAHPELAFTALAGHPMRFNKKTARGRRERLRALEQAPGHFFRGIRQTFVNGLKAFTRRQVAPDDLLDAYALACTALRIADGKAQRVPPDPPIDRRGLRMEIWY